MAKSKNRRKAPARAPVAIIDVGSHNTRMEIVQFRPSGAADTLERLAHTIPLGFDVFTTGRVSNANIALTCDVMRDFAKVMREYGARDVRAFATSAAREADNSEIFLDRVRLASGIDLRILDSSEEARLFHLSITAALREFLGPAPLSALVCIVGTGSTQIMFVKDGRLISSEAVRVGALRIVEELERPANDRRLRATIEPFIDTMVRGVLSQVAADFKPERFVAVGGPVRALCEATGLPPPDPASNCLVQSMSKARFEEIYNDISSQTPAEITERYGIDDILARCLLPCCDILSHFLPLCAGDSMLVPFLTTRDAVVQDLAREFAGEADPFLPDLRSCAEGVGRRYNYDETHARNVAELSLKIFDGIQALHGLGADERRLLDVAAILHDIGLYVNNRSHHKHSYYLIHNSQLPGLSPLEQDIVAVTARYHRQSPPRPSHGEYMALPPESRVVVCKLAAILRVADSLDFARKWHLRRIAMAADRRFLEFIVEGPVDLALENWAVHTKANLFHDVFGYKIVMASQDSSAPSAP